MKKYMIISGIMLCIFFLSACSSGQTKYYKNHPAKEFLEGDDPSAVCRYSSFTEGTYYCSYGIDEDISEEDLEYIAQYIYLTISGRSFKDGGKSTNPPDCDYSFAFYKDDGEELIEAFMYKDGERQPSSEEDIFIPGNLFRIVTE